jgi:ubiquitin-conjugating enzyme E2 R
MAMGIQRLSNELKALKRDPVEGFTVQIPDESNFFEWDVYIQGPPDTDYEGGIFKARLSFPEDFPYKPPEMKFLSDFWHPNVYADGKVCISILHPPGHDPMSGERAEERWSPIQSVTSVLLSVISLLSDPNNSSPANVDAGVEWRNNRVKFREKIRKLVEKSKSEAPPGLVFYKATRPSTSTSQEPRGEGEYYFEEDDDNEDEEEEQYEEQYEEVEYVYEEVVEEK